MEKRCFMESYSGQEARAKSCGDDGEVLMRVRFRAGYPRDVKPRFDKACCMIGCNWPLENIRDPVTSPCKSGRQ
jgi:hypothetical protein